MPGPIKVSACGFVVKIDTGSGFVTQGLVESINPWGKSKAVVETPTLDCEGTAEVGREETSQLSFVQFYDPQQSEYVQLDTNFEDSRTDLDIRDVEVQLISGAYNSDDVSAKTVTQQATCQIVSLGQEELTPDGFWKRTVTLVRKSDITPTIANSRPLPRGVPAPRDF